MNILITVKKVGNHWYPNLSHDDPMELILDPKMERFCTLLDKYQLGTLTFLLQEVYSWTDDNTIQFDDDDIWKWLNSDANFTVRMYIKDHEFEVSTLLMDLFETQFNTNFHKTLYKIELMNI